MKNLWKFVGALIFGVGASALAIEVWDERKAPKAMMPALPSTKQTFVDSMKAAIGSLIPDSGVWLTIAWAAFESDWGRTTGFQQANNPFNITAGSHWTGDTVPGPDTQYDSSGKVTNISQQWRKYGSLADGVAGMVSFLSNGGTNYSKGLSLLKAGDIGFVDAIRAGGYFTFPLDKYRSNVQSILSQIQPTGVA